MPPNNIGAFAWPYGVPALATRGGGEKPAHGSVTAKIGMLRQVSPTGSTLSLFLRGISVAHSQAELKDPITKHRSAQCKSPNLEAVSDCHKLICGALPGTRRKQLIDTTCLYPQFAS